MLYSSQTGSGSEATFGTVLAPHHASGHANLNLTLGSSDRFYATAASFSVWWQMP